MAATALKVLHRALTHQHFDAAYYIYGGDEFQKNDAVRQLVDAAVDPATRDFNLEFRCGDDLDVETVAALVGTPPMMAARRVVVVRDVNALRREARAILDRYLKRPSPDTTLLLVTTAGTKPDKGLEELTTPLKFDPLEDHYVPTWIVHYASTQCGTEITPDAAELLQSAVGNDLYQLVAEIDKLASYTSSETITEEVVSNIVGIRRGEMLGDLLDAVLECDATKALDLVPHILMQPKTTAVSVIMALSTQMLAVAWGCARLEGGLPLGRLEGEFFSLLKTTSAFPMRPWGEAVKAWAHAVPYWSVPACNSAIDALITADVALKETRISSEEQLLATTVLALCAATPRQQRVA